MWRRGSESLTQNAKQQTTNLQETQGSGSGSSRGSRSARCSQSSPAWDEFWRPGKPMTAPHCLALNPWGADKPRCREDEHKVITFTKLVPS